MITENEKAWAAGFFDGEGSIYVWTVNKKYPSIQLDVHQTDIQPLERFFDAIDNIGNIKGPYKKSGNNNYKPFWKWNVAGLSTVISVCQILWPYLSDPKKDQILFSFDKLERLRSEVITNT